MSDSDFEKLSTFSCGERQLDNFFQHEIKVCVQHHYLAAYCAYLTSGDIIAAFTLMNDALMISGQTEKEDFIEDLKFEVNEDVVDFLNIQTSYPAINIGHLGISVAYQSQGIGSSIVDLVVDTYSEYRQAGCQFITVDALNNQRCLNFYRNNGFSFQTNRDLGYKTRRLYHIL